MVGYNHASKSKPSLYIFHNPSTFSTKLIASPPLKPSTTNTCPSLDSLINMRLDLSIPYHFHPRLIHDPFRYNLVAPNRRPKLGPQRPVRRTEKQNGHSHYGKNIIRIPIGVPVPVGRNKRHNSQESIA